MQVNIHATADALANLGFVLLHQDKLDQAQGPYVDALRLYRELNNEQGMADAFSHLGLIEFCNGNLEAAYQYHSDSLAIWQRLDDKQGIAWALRYLGNTALRQGQPARAREFFEQSLSLSVDLDSKWLSVYALEGLASLLAMLGKHRSALTLAGFCEELRRSAYIPLSHVERQIFEQGVQPARQALDTQTAAEAHKHGRGLSMEEAVQYAHQEVTTD
jgi:tetratricopeptide (TPR) repeat protein